MCLNNSKIGLIWSDADTDMMLTLFWCRLASTEKWGNGVFVPGVGTTSVSIRLLGTFKKWTHLLESFGGFIDNIWGIRFEKSSFFGKTIFHTVLGWFDFWQKTSYLPYSGRLILATCEYQDLVFFNIQNHFQNCIIYIFDVLKCFQRI